MVNDGGPTWLLTLAYAGHAYAGWQIQPERPTVQGCLNAAMERLYGTPVLTQGCSRTDRGVHALAQQVTFAAPPAPPIAAPDLARALNRLLPADIRLLELREVAPDFHARHAAIGKAYTYVWHRGEPRNPFLRPFCTPLRWELDRARLEAAGAPLLGCHDFSAFGVNARSAEPVDPMKTLQRFQWIESGRFLAFSVVGDSFLYRMVRRLAGYFVEVGRGRLDPAAPESFMARDGQAGFPTADPEGLFLHAVFYDSETLTAWRCRRLPFLELLDLPDEAQNAADT